jgi:CRP-like cAMP-binding protein/thioredoxin reductase/Fe-S-cluster-containing dehydrogenase component
MVHYEIIIIGSGPAGLSAAARCAVRKKSHILLERAQDLNDTIRKYFKGKLVMDTPSSLRLRSDLPFYECRREAILHNWQDRLSDLGVNFRTGSFVTNITGQRGSFHVTLNPPEILTGDYVIVASGIQGDVNTLDIAGSHLDGIIYQLDDADQFRDREIIIVGNGDSAVENSLALCKTNSITLINRKSEYPNARIANRTKLTAAVNAGEIQEIKNTTCKTIRRAAPEHKLVLTVSAATGETDFPTDYIIARIGSQPQRQFLERVGLTFASDASNARPLLSDQYESVSIPGLYVIGALAGYPLIKQCLNQGYDVVETIVGNRIVSVQDEAIEAMLAESGMNAASFIILLRERFTFLDGLTTLQVRDYIRPPRGNVRVFQPGELICRKGDYAESLYLIVDGCVGVIIAESGDSVVELHQSDFFGEMALLSGRRRSRDVVATQRSLLLEIDRNTMLHLMEEVPEISISIGRTATLRFIKTYLATAAVDDELVGSIIGEPEVFHLAKGEILIKEGEIYDDVYLIERGAVAISRIIGSQASVMAYLPAGSYVGEIAATTGLPRSATVSAAVPTDVIKIPGVAFAKLLNEVPALRSKVNRSAQDRLAEQQNRSSRIDGRLEFLLAQGFAEATNALLIDQSLCVACNNCEDACAATHDGISRLRREDGPTFGMLHVPIACRHCEDPHCMDVCPPNVISRLPTGEVVIDDAGCIHCGKCAAACPYDAIEMAQPPRKRVSNLLTWLLFGSDTRPGVSADDRQSQDIGAAHPIKCDGCASQKSKIPACVRACPTGAAFRINFEEFAPKIKAGLTKFG